MELTELQEDNLLTVSARCTYSRTGEGLHRFTDPADSRVYLYAHMFLDGARRIFPCFDQPDIKATYRFTVTAPTEAGSMPKTPPSAQLGTSPSGGASG